MLTTEQHGFSRYWRQPAIILSAVIAAFLLGLVAGGSADDEVADRELEIAELTNERDELESALALSPSDDEVEQLTKRIGELEDELDEMRTETAERLAEQSEREDEIAQREEVLAERESELDSRESALDEREEGLVDREAAATQPEAQAEPESGCQPGQVDINTASIQELQRIYEIGPARAEQVVDLRPFSSVDDLTRVSGIAEGRLGGIKNQGLACVD